MSVEINEHMTVCFVNTDQLPIKTEHVCYFTQYDSPEDITLCEVVREYYPHPNAPENAIINILRTQIVHTYKRREIRGANSILLEAAQKACRKPQLPL